MANKVHFVCCQTELQDGPVKAVCGKVIEKPKKCFCWDELATGEEIPAFSLRGGCLDCLDKWVNLEDGIVYGIRERSE